MQEFPKIRGTLFWVPHNKDPIFWVLYLDVGLGSVIQGFGGLGRLRGDCSSNQASSLHCLPTNPCLHSS